MYQSVINCTPKFCGEGHIEVAEIESRNMTILHDQLRDDIRAEEHSAASIAIVAVVMIIASSVGLLMTL